MARVTVEDCLEHEENRFALVILAARRTRQLLKGAPLGYLLTGVLTILLALVGAMVIAQTIMQLSIGVELSPGQLVGMVSTWIVMGGIAVWLSIVFLQNLPNSVAIAE